MEGTEDVTHLSWYYGALGREAADEILIKGSKGSFLLRDKSNGKNSYVLCVRTKEDVQHYVIHRVAENNFVFESTDKSYASIDKIIEYYRSRGLVAKGQTTRLKDPIEYGVKEENIGLELNEDDDMFRQEDRIANLSKMLPSMDIMESKQESQVGNILSKRQLAIVLGVIIACVVIVIIILSITLTMCGSGWCKNGSFCKNSNCQCKDGWEGKFCDKDIDECSLPLLSCVGDCKNTPGSFKCSCPSGYSMYEDGSSCMIDSVIEMVRFPKAKEMFDDEMHQMEFVIHQGNKMRKNQSLSRQRRNSLTEKINELEDYALKITDCDVFFPLDLTCEWNFVSKPVLCAQFDLMLNSILDGLQLMFPSKVNDYLDLFHVSNATINSCTNMIHIKGVYEGQLKIIPSFLLLQDIEIDLTINWTTKQHVILLNGTWTLGNLRFDVSLNEITNGVEIKGLVRGNKVHDQSDIESSFGEMVSSVETRNAFQAINVAGLSIDQIEVYARHNQSGHAIGLSFDSSVERLSNVQFFVSLEESLMLNIYSTSVCIAMVVTDLSLAALVSVITGVDISSVPIIKDFSFTSAGIAYSNNINSSQLETMDNDNFNLLFPLRDNLNLVFQTRIHRSAPLVTFYVGISEDNFDFEIVSNASMRSKDLLDVVTDTSSLNIPSGFNLQEILEDLLDGFMYNVGNHRLSVKVKLPTRIILIRNFLTLENAMAMFTISADVSNQDGVNFEAVGEWFWRTVGLKLRTKVIHNIEGYTAEISSPIAISAYDIIGSFYRNGIPDGMDKLIKRLGMDDLKFSKPSLSILIQDEYELRASGSVTSSKWIDVRAELFYRLSDHAVALGLITSFEEGMKKIDAGYILNSPGMNILRGLDLGIFVCVPDMDEESAFQGFQSQSVPSLDIKRGISLGLVYKVPSQCTDDFCRFSKNIMGPNAVYLIQGSVIIDPFQLEIYTVVTGADIEILNGVKLTDVGLRLQVLPPSTSLGFTCTLRLQSQGLELTGVIGLQTEGLFVELSTSGYFPLIPVINVLTIGEIYFKAAIGPSPVGVSELACGCTIRLGLMNRPSSKPMMIRGYFGLSVNPGNNYFYGNVSKLTIGSLLAAFDFQRSLPNFIAETGFPDGLEISFSSAGRVLSNGIIIPRGFRFAGAINILNFVRLRGEISVSENALSINVTLKSFAIAGGLISLRGLRNEEGPRLMVDLSWIPPRSPAILIDCTISILNIAAGTEITMNSSGTVFYLEGRIFNLFQASLLVKTRSQSIYDAEFYIEAQMKQDLFSVLRNGALGVLDSISKSVDRLISNAQNKIDNARGVWDDAKMGLKDARKQIEDAKAIFLRGSAKIRSARQDLDKAHETLNHGKSRLSRAQDKIRGAQDKLRRAKERLFSCPSKPKKPKWYQGWKFPKYIARKIARAACKAARWVAKQAVNLAIGVLHVAIGAVEAAKGIVSAAKVAVYVAQGALKAGEILVAQSRHLLDVGKAAVSAALFVVDKSEIVLDVAIAALEVIKQANKFGVKILEGIVQFALGGIFDIKELYFSAMLATIDETKIEARIGISWFGGETQHYGFALNLGSVSDMVGLLVDILKKIAGVFRSKREIPYNILSSVGPQTLQLFGYSNSTSELAFVDCKLEIKPAVVSLLEMLNYMRNIALEIKVEPSLVFHSQYHQDSVLVVNDDAREGLRALRTNIDSALQKTTNTMDMMEEEMQKMEESEMENGGMEDMMSEMSAIMTDLSQSLYNTEKVQSNGPKSFVEELEKNITRDNPQTHSRQTELELNMTDRYIGDISDKEINDAVHISDMSTTYFHDLEEINENDTNALQQLNDSIRNLQPMLLNIAKDTEQMKATQVEMWSDAMTSSMGGMMSGAENSDTIMRIIGQNRHAQMGVNVTNQLMRWFEIDLNSTDDEFDAMEQSILMQSADIQDQDDEMMMAILERNLQESHDLPMQTLDNVEMQLRNANGEMQNMMSSMGDVMSRMKSQRSKRETNSIMRDMQTTMNDLEAVKERLLKSKDMMESVDEGLDSSENVLDYLEQREQVDSGIITDAKDTARDINRRKDTVDDITESTRQRQRLGFISWLSFFNQTIYFEKNITLPNFMQRLRRGISKQTLIEPEDTFFVAFDRVVEMFDILLEEDAGDNSFISTIESGIAAIERVSNNEFDLCRRRQSKKNTAAKISPNYLLLAIIALCRTIKL